MSKKCKHCDATLGDTEKICSKCGTLSLENDPKFELSLEQFKELSNSVSESLANKPRFLWSLFWKVGLLIFALLGIPGAITGFNILESFEKLQTASRSSIESNFNLLNLSLTNQIQTAHSEITSEVSSKFQLFAQDASNQIASAYSSITNEIAEDFQTPTIRQTMESVAKGQAKEILQQNVEPEVDKFRQNADFLRLCARARAYDFRAYQQLLELQSQTNEYADIARETICDTDRSLDRDRIYDDQLEVRLFEEFAGTNLYKGPFTSDEIVQRFPIMHLNETANTREAFINCAADCNQTHFLPFFMSFLTNEPDLMVADRVTVAISKLVNQDFHPHDLKLIELWWQAHQNKYTVWPIEDFNYGSELFCECKYKAAAESFERVLQVDSTADTSRAFAILCNCQIHDTNEVETLVKGFKYRDGRWAKLAEAKIELDSGSTSNATVELAFLQNTYPEMAYLPHHLDDLWKKLDWQSFDRLTTPGKP